VAVSNTSRKKAFVVYTHARQGRPCRPGHHKPWPQQMKPAKITGRLKLINIARVLAAMDHRDNYFYAGFIAAAKVYGAPAARACLDVRVYYTTKPFSGRYYLRPTKRVRDHDRYFLEHAYTGGGYVGVKVNACRRPGNYGDVRFHGWVSKERSYPKKLLCGGSPAGLCSNPFN